MKHLLITAYQPGDIYWFVRCNFVIFTDIGVVEFTFGLIGFGILIQFGTKERA